MAANVFNDRLDAPGACAICGQSFSETELAGHFEACFESNLPTESAAEPDAPPENDLDYEPQYALFGIYLPGALVDAVLSHSNPEDLGHIYQASKAWQTRDRSVARALASWSRRENERLDEAFQSCACRPSQAARVASNADVPAAGKVAMRLLNCLRARSVQVCFATMLGKRFRVTLVAKPEANEGVLSTVRVGDLYLVYGWLAGIDPRCARLLVRANQKKMVHHDASLLTYLRAPTADRPMTWLLDGLMPRCLGHRDETCVCCTCDAYEAEHKTTRTLLDGSLEPASARLQEVFRSDLRWLGGEMRHGALDAEHFRIFVDRDDSYRCL
jgi:hypothetical protein